jgi:hypothetical protein
MPHRLTTSPLTLITCHMSILYHATSTSLHSYHSTSPCHVSSMYMPHQHYMDCTVNKIFHVWQSGQNMISHSYDVFLNPFKLCWDREDEAYIRVYFEAIPRTLIFEHILIPWIRITFNRSWAPCENTKLYSNLEKCSFDM